MIQEDNWYKNASYLEGNCMDEKKERHQNIPEDRSLGIVNWVDRDNP